jgi:hypothetical protein
MSKLSEKEFAHIVRTAPEGASEDDVMEAARRLEASQPKERKGLLARVWEWVNKPTIDLPDIDLSTNTGIVGVDAMSRVPGLAGSLVEGLSSPIGLASAVLSGGASLAGRAGLLGISRGARIAEAALSAPYAATGAYHAAEGIREGDLGKAAAGAIEGGLGAYGARSAMTHAFPVDKVAKAYAKKAGIQQPEPQFAEKWDQGFASRVADAYDEMPHAPNDPRVKSAYDAMGREVSDQFEFVTQQAGVKMEPWTQPGQPYANSAEMMADVRKNNRLYYFPSEAGYGQGQAQAIGEFPLLQPGRSGQPVNDEFRAIHDYFGHARRGHQFGPLGEENAYREHASLFSNEAIPALTTETRGQNSWVNAGKHLRRPDGSLPKRGDPDFIKPQDRPFAEQKAGILPKQFQGDPALDSVLNSGQPYGILSAGNPMGQVLDEAANASRHQNLLADIRAMGLEPIEQKGVFGGNPEPSVLVPGMSPDQAKELGRKYGQEAVISQAGWHRMGDDATFPRQGSGFDQRSTDYYSEVQLPAGQTTKYQLEYPPAAFDSPAPSVDPTGSMPDGRTDVAFPSSYANTAMSVAAPAAAVGIPDDPESNWDEGARALLLALGGGALAQTQIKALGPMLPKSVGSLARALQKTKDGYVLKPQVVERLKSLYETGRNLPKQSNWEGANEELLKAFDGDQQMMRRWGLLWGATSPNTSVPRNTQESLAAQMFSLENPGKLMDVPTAQTLEPSKITMAPSKVPNINLALQGKQLGSPKVDRMGRFMTGEDGALPLDVHALWGLGAKSEKFDMEESALRQMMTKREGLPLRGSLSTEDIYSRVESAMRKALAEEIAPGQAVNPTFATLWEGIRSAKGLKPQGGPVDILRKKGLLEAGAMLDPKRLREVLKTAGWTAGAIGMVLKAMSTEPKPES